MPLSQGQFNHLKGLWLEAGGGASRADVAAAVAFAESSGCQYALAGPIDIRPVKTCTWNVTDGENSCGYWQINLRAHPGYHAPTIFDELVNAGAAVAISDRGKDFGPWSTYVDGAYKPFLEQYAGQPASGGGGGTGGGGDTSATEAIDGTWATGYASLARQLSRGLPTDLRRTHRYRQATLNALRRGGRVS